MAKDSSSGLAPEESIRTYLKETLEHLLAAGHSTYEVVEFSLDKFGRRIIPHLKELQEDIRQSRVKIQNGADSAITAVFGIHVTAEQREELIREAAYLRGEKRNFAGGDQDQDWLLAEREVDEMLARQQGLLEKAHKNIESVSEIAKNELTEVKGTLRHWLKAKGANVKKAG